MSEERLRFQGRLAEKEQEMKSLIVRIAGLRDSIRIMLDPFGPLPDIKADVVAAQAVELANHHIRYMELRQEITAIEKVLGK